MVQNAVSIKEEEYSNIPTNKAYFTLQKPHFAMHRGYRGEGIPENSTGAFENAGAHGAWGCETDIRETSDGHYICMHDSTVDRTTEGNGEVSAMTFSQIRALHLEGTDYIVPTLQEYLQICKTYGMVPCVEIKGINNGKTSVLEIMDIIKGYGLDNNCIITGTIYIQQMFRNEYKHVPCMVNVDTTTPSRYSTIVDQIKHYENMIIAFEHSEEYLTAEVIKNAHKNNIGVCVWTVNDTAEAKAWFGMGADLIGSNNITDYGNG